MVRTDSLRPRKSSRPAEAPFLVAAFPWQWSLVRVTAGNLYQISDELAAIDNNTGPDFFETAIFGDGITIASLDFALQQNLTFNAPIATIKYSGSAPQQSPYLDFVETLGQPVVQNVVACRRRFPGPRNGRRRDPRQCRIFLRGDANLDGARDIGDPISLLGVLFANATPIGATALDANDDRLIDIGCYPDPVIPFWQPDIAGTE